MSKYNTQFTIYSLKSYKGVYQIKDGWKGATEFTAGTIEQVSEKLNDDEGWHIRIKKSEKCIVYIDFDHCKDEAIFEKFIELLCEEFDVDRTEISYTLSVKPEEKEFSYHISIPSIQSTPEELHSMFFTKAIFNEFNKKGLDLIDSCVYSDRWFRLPGQTVDTKPLKHNIINGKPEDFLVHYIGNVKYRPPEGLTEIEAEIKTVTIEVKQHKNDDLIFKQGKTKEDYITQQLDILADFRAESWEKWRNVGFMLHHELGEDGFDLFDDFSKKYQKKYNKVSNRKFWDTIKNEPPKKPLTIKSLMRWAKKDSPTKYSKFYAEFIQTSKNYNTTDEYEKIKIDFEMNNFKILNPISYATIDKKGDLIIRNKTDFYNVYENLRYNTIKKGESIEVSFVDKWFKDKEMRTYDRIDFLPQQQAPDDVYNTFKGYEAEKKELFDVDIENSLVIKHLKNLCNNETATYEYTLNTLARKIQQPYNLTNTAVIFKSKEGAGKDLFFHFFGNQILGSDYYFNTDKPELLFGKFNSCVENKILVIMNETSGKDTYQINENIKCAITAQINTIEHKGMKPYKNTNHIEYVFLTNNDNPIKVPQGDRRFCGIECNNNICNDKDYFDALRAEMDSGKLDKAFYNYLMEIDINNYDFTNNRPITQFYSDMKEMNTPPLALFLESIIMNNNTLTQYKIESSTLFKQYSDYISTFNFKCQPTLTKFVLDIKKIDGVEQKKSSTSRFLIFDLTKLKNYLITTYKISFDITDDDNDDDNSTVSTLNLLDQ